MFWMICTSLKFRTSCISRIKIFINTFSSEIFNFEGFYKDHICKKNILYTATIFNQHAYYILDCVSKIFFIYCRGNIYVNKIDSNLRTELINWETWANL